MVDSEPSDALGLASVADPDVSGSADVSGVTGLGSLLLSVLSPAVTRSVSVTDFLSSLADQIKPGFIAFGKIAECYQQSTLQR
jgi:hypothetical protein